MRRVDSAAGPWLLGRIACLLTTAAALSATASVPAPAEPGLLRRALAAHGGDVLMRTSTLTAEWTLSWALIHEDREPGPPWDHSRVWTGIALDLVGDRLAERRRESGAGYLHDVALQAGPAGAEVVDLPAGTRRLRPELTSHAAGADARRRLPGLILRRAAEEPARWQPLPDGRCGGADTRRARFDDVSGESWTLHLDPRTHLSRCLEYTFETYEGVTVPVTLEYRDWRTVDGLSIPQDIEARGRDVSGRQRLANAAAGVELEPYFRRFDVPLDRPAPDPGFRSDEIAPGVWVIGEGVFRQLFVELREFVVAYDGLGGDVGRRLAALAERTGGKPVRYVVLSHPHAEHFAGLPELVDAGATVVAHRAHWPAVRQLARLHDDDWQPLRGDWVLEEDQVRLVAADIGPTPHAGHLVVLWLPQSGVLGQSDLFVPRRGAIRAASPNVHALAQALRERGWQPRIIQDAHSPRLATSSDLDTALARRPITLPPVWLTLQDFEGRSGRHAAPPTGRDQRKLYTADTENMPKSASSTSTMVHSPRTFQLSFRVSSPPTPYMRSSSPSSTETVSPSSLTDSSKS